MPRIVLPACAPARSSTYSNVMFRQLEEQVSSRSSNHDRDTHVRYLLELDGQNISRSCHGRNGPFGLIHNNSLFVERSKGVREVKAGAEVTRVVRKMGAISTAKRSRLSWL